MYSFNVFAQLTPKKISKDLWEPCLPFMGVISADSTEAALKQAKEELNIQFPMVSNLGGYNEHGDLMEGRLDIYNKVRVSE